MIEAGAESGFKVGDYVFVPGANCFENNDQGPVRGLFGAASRVLVSQASRVTKIDRSFGPLGALLALALWASALGSFFTVNYVDGTTAGSVLTP